MSSSSYSNVDQGAFVKTLQSTKTGTIIFFHVKKFLSSSSSAEAKFAFIFPVTIVVSIFTKVSRGEKEAPASFGILISRTVISLKKYWLF